ncbi:MAG TPA: cytochrome ubiquinol oxidase subunit I [Nocardioidaceae bacterium]|nr:cytochrome ubiquinol oxidase subunit I [Nocardioidaceae bacterium]
MDALDLARSQFAATSIYHFLFVPLTIGLAFLVAVLHTKWFRSGNPDHKRLTRFFGTLLLINVAVGVVTGLVQEFQFGMNWSAYSRFVGDVFGAPLAMEGLAAFFLESTFLGLWVFGWNVLPRRVHLLTVWLVAFGAALSAAFIMAANSWMQHPVGYTTDPESGRPQLSSIGDMFTNTIFVWAYVHVILASLLTGAMVMLAVSAWQLRRKAALFRTSATLSLVVLLPVSVLALMVGSRLGVEEARYQPMKIAAAEAQWTTCQPCSFSLFQIGGGNDDRTPTQLIEVPHLLSLLATGTWNGRVEGMDSVQNRYQQQYGPGDYVPNVFVQYWSMRVMAYLGSAVSLLALWGIWLAYRRKLATSRVFLVVASWAVVTPFLMNTAGWMLTENGRQPWLVQGLMTTADGVSTSVSTVEVAISLAVFLVLYAALGFVDAFLMLRYARRELDPAPPDETPPDEEGAGAGTPALAY